MKRPPIPQPELWRYYVRSQRDVAALLGVHPGVVERDEKRALSKLREAMAPFAPQLEKEPR